MKCQTLLKLLKSLTVTLLNIQKVNPFLNSFLKQQNNENIMCDMCWAFGFFFVLFLITFRLQATKLWAVTVSFALSLMNSTFL